MGGRLENKDPLQGWRVLEVDVASPPPVAIHLS